MSLIIQTCVPSYRLNVYKKITLENPNVKIISGDEYNSSTIKSDKNTPNVIWVKNYFFFKRKLLFQKLPWTKVFNSKSVIIEFNLKIVSFYIVFFIRLLLNKKTYLWGHAWSKKGRESKIEYFRYVFKKMSAGFIAYTLQQKQELEQQLPNKKIYAACNSIYSKNQMNPIYKSPDEILDVIYVGRLVQDKKILFLVKAFHEKLHKLPSNAKLIIVGDGDQAEEIKNYVVANNLSNKIILKGAISDYKTLQELYATSLVSVSPGYVGLSITQSLGFGVPMLISKDEIHSPEIEAANIGFNSIYFETDNVTDLINSFLQLFEEKESWIAKRDEISKNCRNNYSIEIMAKPFLKIFTENG